MLFQMTAANVINFFFIAAGIGICSLCSLQITSSVHLEKAVRRYFQFFFLIIIIYITMHLIRQLMDGLPGDLVRASLYSVTFAEVIAAGIMALLISMLILTVSRPEKAGRAIQYALLALLVGHVVVLVAGQMFGKVFYFDADNLYHRSSYYLP